MNKRSALRLPLHQKVDLYRHGSFLGRGKTKDIHIDGAFISACPMKLLDNELLQLRFYLGEDGQQPVYLKGMVVHGSDTGVGVLFSYNEKQFKVLLRALYNNQGDNIKLMKNC